MNFSEKRLRVMRTVWLCAVSFIILFSYSICRPATESLFLQAHTSKGLPGAWILVAIFITICVAIYNKHVAKSDLMKVLGASAGISAIVLVILISLIAVGFPGSYYALYVWKDVHVMILLENYFSFANSAFPIKTARWVYGIMGTSAAVAEISGNALVASISKIYGSENMLLLSPPLLLLVALIAYASAKGLGIGKPKGIKGELTLFEKLYGVMHKSSYLPLVLVLILLIQVVTTLIDFKFNSVVEIAYPQVDMRTAVIAKVYGAIAFINICLSLLTGPILRLVGVPITLIVVPMLLGAGLGVFKAIPKFFMMAIVKIGNKCMDYTINKSAKEILYIPLSYAERTMGKSVIDMLTYRVAKGGASLLLLGLIALNVTDWVLWLIFSLIICWIVISVIVGRRFRQKVSRRRELHAEEEEAVPLEPHEI